MTTTAAAGPIHGVAPKGVLQLVISERGERSVASRQFHEGALRVLRPHYLDDSGQVCYVVVNPGGAYLGADLFVLDVEVQDGADLLLTTQSATKVYRTPGSFAEQRMTLRLGEGARLELMPDQLIAYREASYRQRTHITVRPSSSLVMAEVVTPGWSPDGAAFRYEEVRLRNEIRVEGPGGIRLLALDNLGVDVTALIAGLGVGGVAVALALQNILGDLLASLSLSVVALALAWFCWKTVDQSMAMQARSISTLQVPMAIPQGFWWAGIFWFAFVAVLIPLQAMFRLLGHDRPGFDALIGSLRVTEEMSQAGVGARSSKEPPP